MVDSESVFSLPPPLPVVADPEPPPDEPSVHTYGPHPRLEGYIRIMKRLIGITALVLLLSPFILQAISLLVEGAFSSLGFSGVFLPTLGFFYGYIFLFHLPRYLGSQKVTLTDTHLRIERKVHRKQTLVVPRSSIHKVKLKDGKMYSRHALKYLHVYARDRGLPWHVRLSGGQIQLFGLDRPGHLKSQLQGPDGSEIDSDIKAPAATTAPEKPTWTRHQ